jgi:hypothetical protein
MCPGRASSLWRPWLLIPLGMVMGDSAFPVEWTGSPGIVPSISAIYTDNVCQSSGDKRGKLLGGFALSTSPSGSIQGRGSRSNFSLGGSVQFNTLSSQIDDDECGGGDLGNGNRESFTPNLNARGSARLIDNWLNIDVNGRAAQNQINPLFGGGANTLNGNGNTNTYYRYSISPVISRRLKGGIAESTVRYTYDEIVNSQNAVSDSTSNALVASLANGQSSQISWNLGGNYRRVAYSDYVNFNGVPVTRKDSELKNASLQTGYQIDRRWQINGRYGWEWNDYQTVNNSKTGGLGLDFGVRWTPTARTRVGFGITDRYFGTTPRMDISHTHKRSVFTANYDQKITFARDIRTQEELLNPGFIPNSAQDSPSAIIEERFNLGYTYTGRRAIINVSGNYSFQTREDDGQEATFKGIAVTFSPLVSRTYTMSGTLAWNAGEPLAYFGNQSTGVLQSTETWVANVQVGRQFNNRLSATLGYQFTDQQSDDSGGDYQENRVIATLNLNL